MKPIEEIAISTYEENGRNVVCLVHDGDFHFLRLPPALHRAFAFYAAAALLYDEGGGWEDKVIATGVMGRDNVSEALPGRILDRLEKELRVQLGHIWDDPIERAPYRRMARLNLDKDCVISFGNDFEKSADKDLRYLYRRIKRFARDNGGHPNGGSSWKDARSAKAAEGRRVAGSVGSQEEGGLYLQDGREVCKEKPVGSQ